MNAIFGISQKTELLVLYRKEIFLSKTKRKKIGQQNTSHVELITSEVSQTFVRVSNVRSMVGICGNRDIVSKCATRNIGSIFRLCVRSQTSVVWLVT